MPITYFSGLQAELLIPALAWALGATVFAVIPVIFWPTVRRRPARRNTVLGVCIAGAVVAAGLALLQVGPGLRAIQDQRVHVQAMIQERYGIEFSVAQVADLVNGNDIKAFDATGVTDSMHLAETTLDSGTFILVHTLPSAADVREFPVKS